MENELIRICGIGILCALGGLILRGKNAEIAALLRVGGLVLMAGMLLALLREPLAEIRQMLSSVSVAAYLTTMLKAIGIAVLCTVCSGVCRDCGESTVATCVEMAGNILILSLCLPIIREILERASALMELG